MSCWSSKGTARFRDELPAECPPKAAIEIIGETIVYRMVENIPPKEKDFRSQRTLQPNKDFSLSECQVRGLSVFTEKADAETAAKGSKNLQGAMVAKVTLNRGAGYIQKTPSKRRKSHCTWWPYKAFDILTNCEVMK